MEVAGLFMPILSVFATLLKSRFFVIYYRCVTLADGLKASLVQREVDCRRQDGGIVICYSRQSPRQKSEISASPLVIGGLYALQSH